MKTKWFGIAKLMEEMGELQAVLGKLMAYPDGKHPDEIYAKPLLDRLHEELGDVSVAVNFFCDRNNDVDSRQVHVRHSKKYKLFNEWHDSEGMTGVNMKDDVDE